MMYNGLKVISWVASMAIAFAALPARAQPHCVWKSVGVPGLQKWLSSRSHTTACVETDGKPMAITVTGLRDYPAIEPITTFFGISASDCQTRYSLADSATVVKCHSADDPITFVIDGMPGALRLSGGRQSYLRSNTTSIGTGA